MGMGLGFIMAIRMVLTIYILNLRLATGVTFGDPWVLLTFNGFVYRLIQNIGDVLFVESSF
jgi:hypothetical protein